MYQLFLCFQKLKAFLRHGCCQTARQKNRLQSYSKRRRHSSPPTPILKGYRTKPWRSTSSNSQRKATPNSSKNFKNKETFIKSTDFSSEEWSQFFVFTRTSWNYLKKYIRVRRAIQLMEEGFLEESNIDALAEEIGYNSRASLYSAFKQVMGTSLPDFRLEREV